MGAHLHFDCFSGISGDMTLGALVDAGAPFADLVKGLGRLGVRGFKLRKRRVERGAIWATKIDVLLSPTQKRPWSLARIRRVRLVACGTAWHAALVARYWIEELARLPCDAEAASDFAPLPSML